MPNDVIVSGVLHLLLMAGMAALPQSQLLQPSRRMCLWLGLVAGATSVVVALQGLPHLSPGVLHVHPPVIAAAAFLFGPLVGCVAAVAALASQWLVPVADWGAALGLAGCSLGLGLAGWLAWRRWPAAVWAVVVALALALPPAVLHWTDANGAATASANWWLHGIAWRYAIGVGTLCGFGLLLHKRAVLLGQLREREDSLRHALQAADGGRWEWDVRTRMFSYRGQIYRATGLPESPDEGSAAPSLAVSEAAALQRWQERFHPDDLQRLAPGLRGMLDGLHDGAQHLFRMRDDQGQWRWVISRGYAAERDASGHALRLVGIDLDITKHYEMQEELRIAQAKYTIIYQTLPDPAGITRLADGCYLDVNPAFERTLGKPRAQILGRTAAELNVWASADERDRMVQALRQHGEVRNLPMTAQSEGEKIPGMMSARTVSIDGEDCLVFVFHDMSQHERIRQELLDANRLLGDAGWMARLGVWEETPGKGITYWSDVCFDIHGLPANAPLPQRYTDEFVAPAWRDTVRARLLEVAERHGQVMDHEMELTRRDGERRTVLQSLSPFNINREDCWLFVLHDITDRKQSEQRLREREELLSLSVAAAALGRWDWDLASGQINGDARWRAMYGLPPATGGMPPGLQWTTGVSAQGIDAMTQELLRHHADPAKPFDVTYQVLVPQGGTHWLRSLGKIVAHDEHGNPARMVGMAIDVSNQRAQEQQLERMAHFDQLTGLPNRVLLEQRLRHSMEQSRAQGLQLGVGYLDLDGFKAINDRLGHAAGDRLLMVVAERLKRSLRLGDCVARLGGDEFVILLPSLATMEECEQRLQAVMNNISSPYTVNGEPAAVTASIGYVLYPDADADPDDDPDADTLLRHADQAMYTAKQAGRNRFHAFDAAQARAHQQRRRQCEELLQALQQGQLALFLQPKVDMRNGTVVGAEALARWHHPERGLLAPGQFLHLLDERAQLQVQFGEWVIDAALALLSSLLGQGLRLPVSINITPEHLHHPGFANWVAARLAQHPQVPPQLLIIELTESAALYDIDHAAQQVAQLRMLGMSVAFDDFGTGYSSLAYLRRLPMDQLKLDRSFVSGMLSDAGDRAIVQGVIGLARSFGCDIVAEGVETVEQGQALLRMGCHLAQGYCIARPMPLEQFTPWAATWQAPAQWREAAGTADAAHAPDAAEEPRWPDI